MRDPLNDVRSGRRPDERTRVTVVLPKVFGDGAIQFRDAMKRSGPDALPGDLGKPMLHQVQPRGPGRGEVQMIARVGGEPGLHLEAGVRVMVVEDHVNLTPPRGGPLDPFQ